MAAQYPQVERIVDLLELGPGKRYLDFGPGTAGFAHLLAQGAGLEEPPVCVDITSGPGPVDAMAWPEQWPFPDNSFDCITAFHLLRRFDDDVAHAFGQEFSRVLAPGGSGLIVEFAPVRSERLNRLHTKLTGFDCAAVDLRGWGRMAALLTECEFGAIDLVSLGYADPAAHPAARGAAAPLPGRLPRRRRRGVGWQLRTSASRDLRLP